MLHSPPAARRVRASGQAPPAHALRVPRPDRVGPRSQKAGLCRGQGPGGPAVQQAGAVARGLGRPGHRGSRMPRGGNQREKDQAELSENVSCQVSQEVSCEISCRVSCEVSCKCEATKKGCEEGDKKTQEDTESRVL